MRCDMENKRSKNLKMFFTMVCQALLRRKLRMFIALLAVAIGATIISGMVTVYKEVPEQMGREFRAYGANFLLLPDEGKTTVDEAALPGVYEKMKGREIVGAAPFLYERIKINESPVLSGGTDFENLKKVSPYWQVEGAMPAPGTKEILLGHELAEKYRAKVGQQILVGYGDEAEDTPFTVAGIVRTGGKEEEFAYMDLPVLQEFIGQQGKVNLVQVSVVAPQEALDAIAEEIHADGTGIRAQTVKQIARSEETVLAKLQALVLLVTAVVLLLTLVCVGTTMTAVVAERRKEIGLKKALGAESRDIAFEFLGESCVLGALGGLLGTALGYLFAESVGIHVFGRSIDFSMTIAVISVLLSIIVTALASLMPVRTAVRVEPAIVLRGE